MRLLLYTLFKEVLKMSELENIYNDMLEAAKGLGKTQQDMVYGDGSIDADIMLIGEAPGAEETRLLRPFVGKAGKNLDEFLEKIERKRCDIYISNVVKFRPFKVSSKGRLSNRPPKRQETELMLPLLLREIEAVAPKVVVTLGNVPLKAVSGQSSLVIGSCHARVMPAKAMSHSFALFALYHPASIIYNRALSEVYQQDLLALKSYLDQNV
jgi:DNA polymerase